jgi:tricorn protease-like protein
MKKIILSSIVLLIFSISIAVFQVSCQKDATANTNSDNNTTGTQQNKIIYLKRIIETGTNEIWTSNYDGSDQKKLNVVLSGMTPWRINISPDGQNIFIIVFPLGALEGKTDIYTCKTDGNNLKKIIDGSDSGVEGLNDIVAY